MRGTSSRGGRQHLDAGDTAAAVIPDRAAAHQRQPVGDFFATGAQRRAAPEIDHRGAQHLAMGLQMRADHFVGSEPAEIHRGRRRQGARIGGEQIAAGRQHVAPSARRRSGGTGCDALAVERRDNSGALGRGARLPRGSSDPWRAAVDVQAVFHGKVFEIAQPGVDAAQRFVGRDRARNAGLPRQTGALRRLDDQLRQPLAAAAIKAVGLRIFVDQPFKLERIAG